MGVESDRVYHKTIMEFKKGLILIVINVWESWAGSSDFKFDPGYIFFIGIKVKGSKVIRGIKKPWPGFEGVKIWPHLIGLKVW